MELPREKNSLTPAQQCAVAARGNVLVMAGAGTGKTHTLVARCLSLICDERVSLDEILIVTFTEAAATEMKQRLRPALEKISHEKPDSHFAEQLALFDAAHLGTLHSFCFKLVREHFHELGLDPRISILDDGQTRLLADETLEEQFNFHYENDDAFSPAVRDLIKIYGNGRDEKIRALIWQLHNYIQTRADSGKWLARRIESFSSEEPAQWRDWWREAIENWRMEWLPVLENLRGENPKAAECLEIIRRNPENAPASAPETAAAEMLRQILACDGRENFPPKKFIALRKPLEDFFDAANFLNSFTADGKSDPLAEDWSWTRGHMKTLLLLAKEFQEKFSGRKRDDGVLDFHDLEQFALKLLWDFESGAPSEIAGRWRDKLRYVFVDEYQDINAAQDKIISAISRDDENANRFLVGDVKQSIYRFRLADPKIFRHYAGKWNGKHGQKIPLAENFRSREPLLDFVNSLFAPLMREEIGGVNYDDEAKLKSGGQERGSSAARSSISTELLLRFKKNRHDHSENETGDDEIADLEEADKEARMLALRLRELKCSGHKIWDGKTKTLRDADWRDMAILLRSPANKAEIFAKQFERAGIPLQVARGGFYDSSEVADLLNLLQLLDNPLQDVPLIVVLRSPVVGLSLDELAEIRLRQHGKFWFALNQVPSAASKPGEETHLKVETFLKRFSRWRKLAQQSSLSQCLEAILDETHYADWLKAQSRGAQRFANVQRFLHLAEQFDEFQRQGLFRFLKFVEAQREVEAEPEVGAAADENAVRLMSIHQSKGLEFPVVALADLGRKFNDRDLRGEIILDETFGLCPRVKPPGVGGRFPGLAYWLAKKNQKRELRGEELRLLYVALTRARDTLILCGGLSEKKWETFFESRPGPTAREISAANNFLDWLAIWFQTQRPLPATDGFIAQNELSGELPHLRWRIIADEELGNVSGTNTGERVPDLTDEAVEFSGAAGNVFRESADNLRRVLEWQYEFEPATKRAAKSSVTALRREANVELADEAEPIFQKRKAGSGKRKRNAADAGTSAHKFLQHFNLEAAADLKSLEIEAARLETENYLSADEIPVLNLKNIAAFWNSETGKQILAQKEFVRRELPFTARFSPEELDEILGTKSGADLAGEFVVVQGVADLAVLLPREIWIVDFKTDDVRARELAEKTRFYAPQLKLYAKALEKIYARPAVHCWLHFLSANRTEKI